MTTRQRCALLRRQRQTHLRVDRGSLIAGLFYGMDGMRVGGTRRLAIAPHLAYGERGLGDLIPPGTTLTVDVTVLAPLP